MVAHAADVTFFSWSDTHYLDTDTAGKEKVNIINNLPTTDYPASVGGGKVANPRGVILQGDLINDGGNATLAPAQWVNWKADFGVNGEGRCKFPAFEGMGNHDVNDNLFMYSNIAARNVTRKNLGLIDHISANGYHYSWDWDGVHFVQLNLFCGNIWDGESDAYGPVHDPKYSRDFLIQDLQDNVGNSGRPVIVIQHYQPTNDNWWTASAIEKWHKALQDYNVIVILTGHQGGGNNNTWRGILWSNSNGSLDIYHISPDNKLTILQRDDAGTWSDIVQKSIYTSYATSGIAAAISNGDWTNNVTPTSATLTGKLLYQAVDPTTVTVYWGTSDAGTGTWQNSRSLGAQTAGNVFSTDVTGLQPWTNYYYRVRATNSLGSVWAATSIPFTTSGNLPTAWGTRFLGFEQRPWGGAQNVSDTFTVNGSGRTIGETSDDFQFAYRSLGGNGEIKARIATVGTNTANPKVGVMLRESLTDNSRHVAMLMAKTEGLRFVSRSTVGGPTTASTNNTLTAPYWVKVTRSGNTFTGYLSADNTTWTQAGTPVTIAMNSNIFAGLAVSAGNGNASYINSSTFDNVTITGDSLPTPPTISDIADQTIPVNSSTGPLAFTVGDLETAPASLTVSTSSSNTSLVPLANIVVSGTDASRSVTVTPVTGMIGSATITLTVSDGALTTPVSFLLTVQAGQLVVGQWQSVSNHSSTPQALLMTETPMVEPRGAGIRRVEVSFSAPITLSDPANAVAITGLNQSGIINLASLGYTVNATAGGSLLAVTFIKSGTLSALPDVAKWRFTLNPAAITASGLVLSASTATTRVLTGLIGDVDGNGRVTGLDLNRIANAGTFTPASATSLRADVNGDGVIDTNDCDAAWTNRAHRTDNIATP